MKFSAEKVWLDRETAAYAPYCFRYFGINSKAYTIRQKERNEDNPDKKTYQKGSLKWHPSRRNGFHS